MKIILASQSAIRKRALDLLNLPYDTIPSHFDEKSIRDQDPFQLAHKLSVAKAKEVAKNHQGIIIASDAFMAFRDKIVEKPKDLEEAYAMLKSFSGSSYQFITGLAVYHSETKIMHSTVESCRVHIRQLHEAEMRDYLARYPVLNYAGAHATEGVIRFSEKIEGNCNFYTAIPMNKLVEFLRLHGLST